MDSTGTRDPMTSNFLVEAMQRLGIYFTPPHVVEVIQPPEIIVGNPPFTTFKRIRRTYFALCNRCNGSGFQATKHGAIRCTNPQCKNGEVEKVINEIVHVQEEQEQGE